MTDLERARMMRSLPSHTHPFYGALDEFRRAVGDGPVSDEVLAMLDQAVERFREEAANLQRAIDDMTTLRAELTAPGR